MKDLLLFILMLLLAFNTLSSQESMTLPSCYEADDLEVLFNFTKNSRKSNQRPRIGVYYEVDHQSFLDHNEDIDSISEWIEGLFSEVRDIYDLHNIELYISDIFIWESPDIYQEVYSIDSLLGIFATRLKNGFQGHVAQLCTTRPLGGGKGILNGICTPYDPLAKKGPYSIATALSTETVRDTSFSWSVYIMAHELGHVLGSPHTQACFWGPQGDAALDNCFGTEGGCEPLQNFNGAGTVMSYCFLQSNGIDFSLGLGPEPGTYVYNNLLSKACLNSCEGILCDDNNPCTINDTMDFYCNCKGILLDINENNICDINEPCDSLLVINQMNSNSPGYLARDAIMNYAESPENMEISMSAGEEIQFMPGASIPNNSVFTAYLFGCQE